MTSTGRTQLVFDRKAAQRYLDRLFTNHTGWLALAAKKMEEPNLPRRQRFQWPSQSADALDWVEKHVTDGQNVFVMPALRDTKDEPEAGHGIGLTHLWAEVDWQKITVAADRARTLAFIKQHATFKVYSGSTHYELPNVHAYFAVGRTLTVDEHYSFNTGLKDHLHADDKQSDCVYLRLPGTSNHKGSEPTMVRMVWGTGQTFPSDVLKAFNSGAVRRSSDAVDWIKVPIPAGGLAGHRRVIRMVTGPSDRLQGAPDRSTAVWILIGEAIKAGFSKDQIHTMMDTAGVVREIMDERPYDVHKDVERRWKQDEAEDEETVDEDDVFEEVDETEYADEEFEKDVQRTIRSEKVRREAKLRIAAADFKVPGDSSTFSLTQLKNTKFSELKYLVGPPREGEKGILGERHNMVLIAQYKSGKTTIAMDLAKSLVDGDPFLGTFPIKQKSVVGFWSLEVEVNELARDFILPLGFENDDLHVFDGVGQPVNILLDEGKAWTVEWLKSRKVKVWMIDSLAVLAVWTGVNIDKENTETRKLYAAIDEIKKLAGVDVSVTLVHTPRAEQEEGKERSRGASAIDEHAGCRWIFTVDGDIRYLRVNGRGVMLKTSSLIWNEQTKRSTLGVGDKAQTRQGTGIELVYAIVYDHQPISTSNLKIKVTEALKNQNLPHSAATVVAVIEDAVKLERVNKVPGNKPNEWLFKIPESTGSATPRLAYLGGTSGAKGRSRR